ncbi:unnamed protein product, partial [Symbiodinium necroappetens]
SWRTVCLSISLRCEVFGTDEARYFAHVAARNTQTALHEATSRSVLQRIYEVITWTTEYQRHHGSQSAATLCKIWNAKSGERALDSQLVEPLDVNWLESADRVWTRLLEDPDCLAVILTMEEQYGKASCLNFMETLDVLCSRGDKEDYAWYLQTMQDQLFVGEASNRDFSSRHLISTKPGTPRYLQLWQAKRSLKNHFLAWVGQQSVLSKEEVAQLQLLGTHAKFRSKMGGGPEKVDVTWQAALPEAARKCAQFLEEVIFNGVHDGPLRNTLKSKSNPADILEAEPLAGLIAKIQVDLDTLKPAEPETKGSGADPRGELGKASLTEVLAGLVQPETIAAKGSELLPFLRAASQHVDTYCQFVVDSGTQKTFDAAVKGTAVARKLKEGQRAMLWYDVKCATESSCQPRIRVPKFSADDLKRKLQAFVSARDQAQLEVGDIAVVLDGMKQVTPGIMACFVDGAGCHYDEKTRTEMLLTYEEQSLRARRCLVRGVLQTHESMHIMTKGPLVLQKLPRKIYGGTNQQTSIGPVKVLPYEDPTLWKLSASAKTTLYGSKGISLAGGPCPVSDPPPLPKLANDLLPVNYHSLPDIFYGEFARGVQAAVVMNATEADGEFAKACLAQKTSYVGIVHIPGHAEMLKKHLVEWVFGQFKDSTSALHNADLCLGYRILCNIYLPAVSRE